MLDLIKYIVNQFAEDKENVEYIQTEKDNVIEVTVVLSPSDMGKVIGKQGKIAKAMRTIVRAATPKNAKRYVVEIREKGGNAVYIPLQNLGHNDGIDYAYRHTDLIKWLLSQRRTDFSEVPAVCSEYF